MDKWLALQMALRLARSLEFRYVGTVLGIDDGELDGKDDGTLVLEGTELGVILGILRGDADGTDEGIIVGINEHLSRRNSH